MARRHPSNQGSKSPMFGGHGGPTAPIATTSSKNKTKSSPPPPLSSTSCSSISTPSSNFVHTHPQQTCARQGCPVASQPPLGLSSVSVFSLLHGHNRCVSDPPSPSPYSTPRRPLIERDAFEEPSFVDAAAATRRPSLSTCSTAPPIIGMASGSASNQVVAESTHPQDYVGFAGFLATLHDNRDQKHQIRSFHGHEAHDEFVASDGKCQRPRGSMDALYMTSKRTGYHQKDPSNPTHFLNTTAYLPSNSSEEDQEGEEETLHSQNSRKQNTARPRHNHSMSVGEGSQYMVTLRPSHRSLNALVPLSTITKRNTPNKESAAASLNNRNTIPNTSSSEDDEEILAAQSISSSSSSSSSSSFSFSREESSLSQRHHHQQQHTAAAEDNEDEESGRGRPRSRRPSSNHHHLVKSAKLVSPFTAAVDRMTKGPVERGRNDSESGIGKGNGNERGRSRQRRG